MELLQLRYFYESAKNESFALTAKKYMVPTSSVSASVKRLERELGINLFDRSTNRIKLNEKGYVFFGMLDEIFKKLDKTVASITESAQQNTTVSVLIKARRTWITEMLIQYKEQFPRVDFQISHDALHSKFESFDVIIDEQSDQYAGMERFLLNTEQICVKAAKNSPLVGRALTFQELKNYSFIVAQKGNRMWQLLERTATQSGFIPKVSIESNDKQCMIRYAESGMGLLLGSKRALQEAGEKNLTALNVTDFNETQSIYVYHRPTDTINVALNGFLSFLKAKGQA
ncbi:MAG: LysR family transcriptional regulator [Clostridia bacterium]|nr:LysR family transcriptional regulator [Clostridia bacterium]